MITQQVNHDDDMILDLCGYGLICKGLINDMFIVESKASCFHIHDLPVAFSGHINSDESVYEMV